MPFLPCLSVSRFICSEAWLVDESGTTLLPDIELTLRMMHVWDAALGQPIRQIRFQYMAQDYDLRVQVGHTSFGDCVESR